MATTLNVRFRTDVREWIARQAAASGLSEARVVELLCLHARDSGLVITAAGFIVRSSDA